MLRGTLWVWLKILTGKIAEVAVLNHVQAVVDTRWPHNCKCWES